MKPCPKTTLKLSVAAIATLFVAPVWSAEIICPKTDGCPISTSYPSGGNASESKEAVLIVPAGNYKNEKFDMTDYEKDRKSYISYSLFDLSSAKCDGKKANLIIQSGVNAVASETSESTDIVNAYNGDHIQIEKGVTLTLNPSYAEAHKLPNRWEDDEPYDSGTAIFSHGGKVTTSADLIINGENGEAINAQKKGAEVKASHHSIRLNGQSAAGIFVADSGKIQADDVTITGKDMTVGLTSWDDSESSRSFLAFDNGTIRLDGPSSAVIVSSGSTISLSHTQAEAGYGIFHYPRDGEESGVSDNIKLTDTTLTGRSALISIGKKFEKEGIVDASNTDNIQPFDINITADKSVLNGISYISPNRQAGSGKLNLTLKNQSIWTYNGSSEVDNLALSDSQLVSDVSDGHFNTLTINNNLTGNGHFTLNTDLAKQQGDKLVVKGKAEGTHTISVNNSKNEPKSAGGKLTLVETQGGSGTFALTNNEGKNYLDAGAYRYDFKKDGNNWVLANSKAASQPVAPVKPAQPPKPDQPVKPKPTEPAKPAQPAKPEPATPTVPTPPANQSDNTGRTLSNYANAPLGYLQAAATLVQQQQTALNQRQTAWHQQSQGRLNGLWIEGDYSRSTHDAQAVGNQAASAGFDMRTNGFQIGYDHRLDNGYIGVLAGRSDSELQYQGDYHNTDLTAHSIGLYGGMGFDNGWFADATYRHTRFKAKTGSESTRFHANSLNLQGGKTVRLNNTWSLVPQAALGIMRLSGSEYSDAATLLHSHIGADLQADYTLANGVRLQPVMGIYYLGDHNHTDVRINDHAFETPNNGHRAALRLGMNAELTPTGHLHLNLQTEHGKDYRRPIAAEIGYRYMW